MAQAMPILFGAQMGLQGLQGIEQMRNLRRAQAQERENALADIEQYRYQSGFALGEAASVRENMLRHSDEVLSGQEAQLQKSGFSGGASFEAIQEESQTNLNMEAARVSLGYGMRSLSFEESAKSRSKGGRARIDHLQRQVTPTILGTAGNMAGTAMQYGSWSAYGARNSSTPSTANIPSYYPSR